MAIILDNVAKCSKTNVGIDVEVNQSILSFYIGDDDLGISHSHAEEVFKPGRRLDDSEKGSGLGLYVVNGIVEMYQGGIKILANKSPGTYMATFAPAA